MKLVAGEEIGRGGFCMVHKVVAYEDDGGDPISATMAIKRLRDDLRESPEDMKEIRDRFEREARLLDDTLDHENIVPVLMRNLSGDEPYFVMPLADANLADLLSEKAGDEDWVCEVFSQILEEWPTLTERGSFTETSSRRTLLCSTGRSVLAIWDLVRTSSAGRLG